MIKQWPQLIYRSHEAKKKEKLVGKINTILKLPTNGLYIVFDDVDYDDYPNPLYRKKAFQMNLKNGIEEMSPSYLLDIMNNPDSTNLVWLSGSVSKDSEERLTWIYSHELRHIEQDYIYPHLSEISHFLSKTVGTLDPNLHKNQLDIPAELDAELRAKQVVEELLGKKRCNSYIEKESQSEKNQKYYERLMQLESSWSPEHLEKKTLELLCNNREHLTVQRRKLEKFGQKFSFDFDLLCAGI